MATKPHLRFVRFSVRTLLIVLTIFCVWLGWTVERARKQREAVEWVREVGGWASYDYKRRAPKWLMRHLGIDFFNDVTRVGLTENLSPTARPLVADVTPVKDLSPLAGLTSLKVLLLQGTQVSDLTPVARLTNLEELFLHRTQVSDVSPLTGLTRLTKLDLRSTRVRDLSPLNGLESVKELQLSERGPSKRGEFRVF